MKKLFAILFALLVLLSGIHLTVASHICCGELAAVKWSVTGEKATCGMEDHTSSSPSNGAIGTDCCKNKVMSCTADSNYYPTYQVINDIASIVALSFTLFPSVDITLSHIKPTYYSMVGPPVFNSYNSVDQSIICVFII